jgi:hypothetical protein
VGCGEASVDSEEDVFVASGWVAMILLGIAFLCSKRSAYVFVVSPFRGSMLFDGSFAVPNWTVASAAALISVPPLFECELSPDEKAFFKTVAITTSNLFFSQESERCHTLQVQHS